VSGRLLIKNGCVITVDEKLGNFPRADVLVENGKIVAVQPDLPVSDAEVVDATGMIVLPGFVDTHRHMWEALIRGIGADWSLVTYLRLIYFEGLGGTLRPQDLYIANLLGALEALDAGVTTVFDWSMCETPEHADGLIQGLQESGCRVVFAYGTGLKNAAAYWSQESTLTHPEDARRVRSQYFSSDDQLVTMALAIRGAEFSPLDITRRDIELARELGVIASMHIGVGTNGPAQRAITRMHEAGLLGPDLNFVHGTTVTDDELRMVADSGGSISICPEVEMQMGHGFPPINRCLAVGLRPTLGVDVVVSTGGDMFAQMKAAVMVARGLVNDTFLRRNEMPEKLNLPVDEVLKFATIDGARALKLDHKVGSLTPGKEADIVLLRTDTINQVPLVNPVGTVVLTANTANVDTVFVRGQAVKRHGQLVGVDMNRLRRLAQDSLEYVFSTWGLPEGAWEPLFPGTTDKKLAPTG